MKYKNAFLLFLLITGIPGKMSRLRIQSRIFNPTLNHWKNRILSLSGSKMLNLAYISTGECILFLPLQTNGIHDPCI